MASIELKICPDGRTRLRAAFCASDLPAIRPSELEGAWVAARRATLSGPVHMADDPDGVIFASGRGPEVCFDFVDYDAYCWALAIDRIHSLHSITGLALCFRMLALYQLLENCAWARPLFRLDRHTGLQIDRNLLVAAATLPLTEEGQFDTALMQQEASTAALAAPA